MPKSHPPYAPEFRAEAVQLLKSGSRTNLTNSRLMHGVRPLGDLPLYVVSRGKPPATVPEGMGAIVARDEAQWRRMQEDLVRLSRRAHHVIAEASGHLVQRDQPSVIVETVRRAVHESRLAGAAG